MSVKHRIADPVGVIWALLNGGAGEFTTRCKVGGAEGATSRNLSGNRDRVRYGDSEAAGDRGGVLLA